jgi:hypothetical protein
MPLNKIKQNCKILLMFLNVFALSFHSPVLDELVTASPCASKNVFTAGTDSVEHFSLLSLTLFHEKGRLRNEQSLATALSHCFQ